MGKNVFSQQILVIFAVLSIAIIGAGGTFFAFQWNELYKSKLNELESVADLKIQGILDWREELVKDGRLVSSLPMGFNPLARLIEDPSDEAARAATRTFASTILSLYGYRGMRLYPISREGSGMFQSSSLFTYPERTGEFAFSSYDDPENATFDSVSLGKLYRDTSSGTIGLSLKIPIRKSTDRESSVVGLLILEVDPNRYLYPFIQTWPTASKTGESLLVRRDGDDVLFLNELRFRNNTAMRMRIPIATSPRLPATITVLGAVGAVEGFDYRNEPVIAWVRPIQGTDWRIVVKLDKKEAFSTISYMGILIAGTVIVFISSAAFGSYLLWGNQRAYLELRASKAEVDKLSIAKRFEYLRHYANDAIILADESLSICETNNSALDLYSYEGQELIGKNLKDLTDEKLPFLKHDGTLDSVTDQGYRFVTRHIKKGGEKIWVEVSARVFPIEDHFFVQEIIRDVTEAKRSREEIVKSMKEKEVLLKELHHRTKNNMQVITSLLIMQADELNDEKLSRSFMEMVGRIRSMALVHEKLYQSANLSSLDISLYVKELAELIVSDLSGSDIDLSMNIPDEPVSVLLDIAIPCGLVINEILTNSIKHAFASTPEKKIVITLKTQDGGIELNVADNGCGLPPGFNIREDGRMGWQTIIAIVETQLRGSVDVISGPGTAVVIRFPNNLHDKRV